MTEDDYQHAVYIVCRVLKFLLGEVVGTTLTLWIMGQFVTQMEVEFA